LPSQHRVKSPDPLKTHPSPGAVDERLSDLVIFAKGLFIVSAHTVCGMRRRRDFCQYTFDYDIIQAIRRIGSRLDA
jgi:hypothetical protein